MICQMNEIVMRVRMAMARGRSPRPLIRCRDPDAVDLDAIIVSKIEQGVERVYREAPLDKLRETLCDFSAQGVCWHDPVDGTRSGHVLLPDDFLRLAVFEMSDWAVPVFDAVDCRSPRYRLIASRYSGLRGSPARPVAALTDLPQGRALEFHACGSDAAYIAGAAYCPLPRFDECGGIDIAALLLDDITDSIAALVSATLGE